MDSPPTKFASSSSVVPAVLGTNTDPTRNITSGGGVEGSSDDGIGVYGHSVSGRGVVAHSESDYAIRATSGSLSAIRADSSTGTGIEGGSGGNGVGVSGGSATGIGVQGKSGSGVGVYGESASFEGVRGVAIHPDHGAIVAYHNGGGIAVYGKTTGNAGYFDGNVHITKKLTVDVDVVLGNADCAEDFTVNDTAEAEPGTVMVLTDAGTLAPNTIAYDTRVTGVVSGAGTYKPALILDRIEQSAERQPIALMGKVWCKVDAGQAPIAVGDMLTTSATPGHAMRASDRGRAFGAVLGKALEKLPAGRGLIRILVCLQ